LWLVFTQWQENEKDVTQQDGNKELELLNKGLTPEIWTTNPTHFCNLFKHNRMFKAQDKQNNSTKHHKCILMNL